ncbi:endolytic transglycosylase MltG [Cellulomonas marina]|uniref:Endolytic murein transglycosylase n=1 Tax=Cellulomonas marina TaxID=988821 RepID=A0A1I0W846_9CELL|nr:endolytic transglycosylase MltG [Cellulomonas marina]GIG29138.1 hypothetical protein Cma02nite_17380 [Cellulomonas marina]SFA84468.1 UPF0755 protein [Cellulomonas marina]
MDDGTQGTTVRSDPRDGFFEAEEPLGERRSRARARAQEAQRRRRRRRSLVVVLVVLLLVGGGAYGVWTVLSDVRDGGSTTAAVEDYPGPGRPSAQVTIPEGATGADMGQVLADAGVVATSRAFSTAYAANPDAQGIQPGTYNLLLEMRATDAVVALLNPASRATTRVTVPEGLTVQQVLTRVSEITTIPLADLQAAAADPAAIGLPAEAGGAVEGWLFPATYEVAPDATAAGVLTQMVGKTVSVLDGLGVAATDRQRVLTMASVAEKEVSDVDDYGRVARVIQNRLDRGWPLGMDTINAYGLGKSAMDLTTADFESDDPYNSRRVLGLPPTPISNPGQAAIEAAITPAEGPWLFFITVDLDTGETIFTDSNDEFLAGKAQYQQWLAENS